jgi:hypothetical protein
MQSPTLSYSSPFQALIRKIANLHLAFTLLSNKKSFNFSFFNHSLDYIQLQLGNSPSRSKMSGIDSFIMRVESERADGGLPSEFEYTIEMPTTISG